MYVRCWIQQKIMTWCMCDIIIIKTDVFVCVSICFKRWLKSHFLHRNSFFLLWSVLKTRSRQKNIDSKLQDEDIFSSDQKSHQKDFFCFLCRNFNKKRLLGTISRQRKSFQQTRRKTFLSFFRLVTPDFFISCLESNRKVVQ